KTARSGPGIAIPGPRSSVIPAGNAQRFPLFLRLGLLRLLVGGSVLDLRDDRRVGEGGRVAERPLVRDVPQEAAHDLAAAGLRQLGREDDVRRLRDRPDLLRDVVAQLLELLDGAFGTALQRHVVYD